MTGTSQAQRPPTPVSSRLPAVVVAYFPDDPFYEQLAEVAAGVDRLVVYDNGGLDRSRVASLVVEIMGDGSNVGIASALNRACAWARDLGYQWLATLDQDSQPTPGMWQVMLSTALERFPLENIGLIAPAYQSNDVMPPMSFRTGFSRDDTRNDEHCGRVWITMTSGNIVSLAAHQAVGGFNEDYFIDQVDHEFCMRLNAHGYVVCEASTAHLVHKIGTTLSIKKFGRLWSVSQHNNRRIRYQARNLSYLTSSHLNTSPRTVLTLVAKFIQRSIRASILLPRQEIFPFLSSLAKGINDALHRRTGALVEHRKSR